METIVKGGGRAPLHPPRGGILGGNPDRSLKSFPPCYSQTPLLTNCTPAPSVFLDLRFLQLCLEISTATAGGGEGGGGIWVNKYLDQ